MEPFITYTYEGISFDLISIEGNTFMIGNNDKICLPRFKVKLSPYYMAKLQVTNELYCAVMEKPLPSEMTPQQPAGYVSWYNAVEFCNRLSLYFENEGLSPVYDVDIESKGPWNSPEIDNVNWNVKMRPNVKGFRLPTEAEWEYAARGGQFIDIENELKFLDDNDYLDDIAHNLWDSYGFCSEPVGSLRPNILGFYDMIGNGYEWCWNKYNYFSLDDFENPKGPWHGGRG